MTQFVTKIFQRQPAWIFHRLGARTLFLIQILAAVRTEALAIIATDCF